MDSLLRTERIPHIWCPGCGIGTVFNALLTAIKDSCYDPDAVAMVSGIGCTGRMAGYIRLDSFHTTHGRALPLPPASSWPNRILKLLSSPVTETCLPSAAIISFTPLGAT